MTVQPRDAVIDLGVMGPPDALPPDPSAPEPRPRRRTGSRLAAAALVTLAASAVAGVPHPAVPTIRHLVTVPAPPESRYAVTREVLYVITEQESDDSTTVTAHDLRDGSIRWSTSFDADVYPVGDAGSDVLLALQETRTEALDEDTGALRGRWDGAVTAVAENSILLAERDSGCDPLHCSDHSLIRRMRLVDPRTGEEIWSRAVPGLAWWTATRTAAGSTDWQFLVLPMPDGWTVVYRYSDGQEVARARLGLRTVSPTGDDEDTDYDQLVGGDGVFYVLHPGDPGMTVTAYRAQSLTRLWRKRIGGASVEDCGPVLCLADGLQLSALDARTGTTLWTRTGSGRGRPLGSDLLIESEGSDWVGPETAVLDARTGRMITPVRPYRQLQGAEEGLLMRPDRVVGGRGVVARLDPASGALTVLGGLDGAAWQNCQGSGSYVVCRMPTGGASVWTTAPQGP